MVPSRNGSASKVRSCTWIAVSTRSGSDLAGDQHPMFLTILAPMVDQVATAPCTDRFKYDFRLLRQSGVATNKSREDG